MNCLVKNKLMHQRIYFGLLLKESREITNETPRRKQRGIDLKPPSAD